MRAESNLSHTIRNNNFVHVLLRTIAKLSTCVCLYVREHISISSKMTATTFELLSKVKVQTVIRYNAWLIQ